MHKIKVLSTENLEEWNSILKGLENNDIYYDANYLKIYEQSYNEFVDQAFGGRAFMFFYGDDDDFVIHIFLRREINLSFYENADQLYDIISPYGYSGPIIKSTKINKEELISKFSREFNNYCKKNNIISEFIRFHPLINNHIQYRLIKQTDQRSNTIFVDLSLDQDLILKNMNKKTRNLIRKAEKNNIQIRRTADKQDLKRFFELYTQTMEKNQTSKRYFFPYEFFEQTFNLLQPNISLFIAEKDNQIISASLFMHKNKYLHYHFSGSDKEFLKFAPNNLLLWHVIKWGKNQGYSKFHLGGGVSKDDSLFHFKSGFSKKNAEFHTCSVIHDENIYRELCKAKDRFDEKQGRKIIKSNFFPYYRK